MRGKRDQFLKTIARLEAAAIDDPRPITGNVGQNCLGYLTLPSGKVVRIVRPVESGEQLGPGSYSPEKPDTFTKSVKISPNSKRFEWAKSQYTVGPADHYQKQTKTRLPQKIGLKQPSKPPEAWKSFNQGHTSWSVPSSKELPKRRFPMFKFDKAKANNSRPFASRQERNLFNIGDVNDLMYDTFPKPVKPNEEFAKQSPVFKSDIPRYSDPINPTPAPCTYNLPDTFGNGRKTGLEEMWTIHDGDPPFSTPGPGAYNPELPRRKVVDVTIGKRINRKVEDDIPGPGAYDQDIEVSYKIPVTFKAKDRRKSQEWCTTPSMMSDSPGAGAYNVERKWEPKGGLIFGGKRVCLIDEREAKKNDHKLAFSTMHEGLLMRTSNSKYQRSIARSSLA